MTTKKRNKNGLTNEGIPYRTKKEKSDTLVSDKVDLSVLTKNEMKLLDLLNVKVHENGRQVYKKMTLMEIQEIMFSAKSFDNYGTSDTRNLVRRLRRTKLIEKPEGTSGVYRIGEKGRKRLAKLPKKKVVAKAKPIKKAA